MMKDLVEIFERIRERTKVPYDVKEKYTLTIYSNEEFKEGFEMEFYLTINEAADMLKIIMHIEFPDCKFTNENKTLMYEKKS